MACLAFNTGVGTLVGSRPLLGRDLVLHLLISDSVCAQLLFMREVQDLHLRLPIGPSGATADPWRISAPAANAASSSASSASSTSSTPRLRTGADSAADGAVDATPAAARTVARCSVLTTAPPWMRAAAPTDGSALWLAVRPAMGTVQPSGTPCSSAEAELFWSACAELRQWLRAGAPAAHARQIRVGYTAARTQPALAERGKEGRTDTAVGAGRMSLVARKAELGEAYAMFTDGAGHLPTAHAVAVPAAHSPPCATPHLYSMVPAIAQPRGSPVRPMAWHDGRLLPRPRSVCSVGMPSVPLSELAQTLLLAHAL
jgi:hypothetical protein